MSVGVDEMSWDDYLEDNYEWTTMTMEEQADYLGRIKEYREKVKRVVLQLLDSTPMVHPISPGSFHWVILMGISHECIHLETSAVIISQVSQLICLLFCNFLHLPCRCRWSISRSSTTSSSRPIMGRRPTERRPSQRMHPATH